MGEWERLKSDFVRGEYFDFLRPHGFAGETRPWAPSRASETWTICASPIP